MDMHMHMHIIWPIVGYKGIENTSNFLAKKRGSVWLSSQYCPPPFVLNTRLCLKLMKIFILWKLQKLEFQQNKEDQQVTIIIYFKNINYMGLKYWKDMARVSTFNKLLRGKSENSFKNCIYFEIVEKLNVVN